MGKTIPLLDSQDAAAVDGEFIRTFTDRLILVFPAGAAGLPPRSLVMVAVGRPIVPGSAVAAATCTGEAVAGFYRRSRDDAIIESFVHREILRWHVGAEGARLHWLFPILTVKIPCCRCCGRHPGPRKSPEGSPGTSHADEA